LLERRAKDAGLDKVKVKEAGRWFRSRADGHRYRFSNAVQCGEGPKMLRVTCDACGSVADHPMTCGATLVCIKCRGALQSERRAKVGNGVKIVGDFAKRRGLMRKNRKGGRWSDKFVTLTPPHLPEHTIGDRIELVHLAWKHFLKAFNGWIRNTVPRADWCSNEAPCRTCERCLVTWYGSHEWTVGSDEHGHPHVQFWFLGPWLDKDDVNDMWRRALEKAGLGELTIEAGRAQYRWEGDVITDVREAKNVQGGIYELIKYVIKDIVANGDFVRPELYAELYENVDGRRLRRGSKGFIALCETPVPCDCGAVGCHTIKTMDRPCREVLELNETESHPPP
jgi:hypothetical protein